MEKNARLSSEDDNDGTILQENCVNCLIIWIAFIILEQKTSLNSIKKYVKISLIIPFEDIKILEFNQYQKTDRISFIIYADLECITEKTDARKNNADCESTAKVREHIPVEFSMSTISSFSFIEKGHDIHRDKVWMKVFCESL